ncbi:eukaryotic translation initiation factor 3 subunit E-like isoform X3 [Contarinia nasturtii]|uniref:eukaryotic translation initiation factor 3 subunit E-like isoform X3 n=1 Tax=Contarinia nasturtii TaxID=265458 RepID=UPI0012D43078|nr:eukaryotic translation initiation factor 3 subunit E-like isoform X3 [Contarinia nasturtii]
MEPAKMAKKCDLTSKICQYLDRHLTFPLLEFLCEKETEDQKALWQQILDIVNKTNLIDYTMDIRKRLQLGDDMPQELADRKANVYATLVKLQEEVSQITEITEILKDADNIKDSKTFVEEIKKEFGYQPEWADKAYRMGKYFYECGKYMQSISYLYFYSLVMQPTDKNYLNVLWGILAAEILQLNWNSALESMNRLRDYIDNSNFSNIEALQQRTWLIHWSVFIFVNHPKGRDLIIEMFLYKPLYLNAIQTMCPHILRYLAAAVVINPGRRNDNIFHLIFFSTKKGTYLSRVN